MKYVFVDFAFADEGAGDAPPVENEARLSLVEVPEGTTRKDALRKALTGDYEFLDYEVFEGGRVPDTIDGAPTLVWTIESQEAACRSW